MQKSRRYKTYNTLVSRLRRNGFKNSEFKNYGSLANYLLFLFLEGDGIVRKSDLVKFRIIKDDDGLTKRLLYLLVLNNFIKHDYSFNKNNNFHQYQVFSAMHLSDLINKEKGEEQIGKGEFLKLKHRVSQCENALIRLINQFDPPATQEKINFYLHNGDLQ